MHNEVLPPINLDGLMVEVYNDVREGNMLLHLVCSRIRFVGGFDRPGEVEGATAVEGELDLVRIVVVGRDNVVAQDIDREMVVEGMMVVERLVMSDLVWDGIQYEGRRVDILPVDLSVDSAAVYCFLDASYLLFVFPLNLSLPFIGFCPLYLLTFSEIAFFGGGGGGGSYIQFCEVIVSVLKSPASC